MARFSAPAAGPTFQGHLRGEHARYDGVFVDFLEGDLTYSPSELTLVHGHARGGEMEADIEGAISLTKWNFLPENKWAAEMNFEKVRLRVWTTCLACPSP